MSLMTQRKEVIRIREALLKAKNNRPPRLGLFIDGVKELLSPPEDYDYIIRIYSEGKNPGLEGRLPGP